MPCDHLLVGWEYVGSQGDRDGGYHKFEGLCESCVTTLTGFGNTPESSSIYERLAVGA